MIPAPGGVGELPGLAGAPYRPCAEGNQLTRAYREPEEHEITLPRSKWER